MTFEGVKISREETTHKAEEQREEERTGQTLKTETERLLQMSSPGHCNAQRP